MLLTWTLMAGLFVVSVDPAASLDEEPSPGDPSDVSQMATLVEDAGEFLVLLHGPPDPHPSGLRSFVVDDGRANEADFPRLEAAARLAAGAAGLELGACDVKVVDAPWFRADVFRIEHGSARTWTVRYVAVDARGHLSLLTSDVDGDDARNRFEALKTFTALAEIERVRIADEGEAADYLGFFLDAFVPRRGLPLGGREAADEVAALLPDSLERELEIESAYLLRDDGWSDRIEILSEDRDGWTARAFVWSYWFDRIDRIDLTLSREGRAGYSESLYADLRATLAGTGQW